MTNERARKWLWLCFAALVALNLYFVRELIAAELIFAMLFGALFFVWFVFFLANEIGERAVVVARRQWVQLEGSARKSLQRFGSQTAR